MHSQALPTTVRAHQPLSEPTLLALSLSKTSLAKVRMSPALSPLAPRSVTVSLLARSTSVSVSSAAAGPIRNADPSAAVRTTAAKSRSSRAATGRPQVTPALILVGRPDRRSIELARRDPIGGHHAPPIVGQSLRDVLV